VAHTLLLADDSVTIQRVIELTFADEDVTVVAVSDGDQAIERLEASPPDIVLADIGMPGKNGYEVAQYIRQSPKLAHIPVVLLTGAFEPVDHARAAEAGCDGVLAKPFEPQLVIARVKELLLRGGQGAGSPEPAPASSMPASPARSADPLESWGTPRVEPQGNPAPSETQVARLDDYFDQLDAAFQTLGSTPRAEPPNAPAAAAQVPEIIDWFGQPASRGPGPDLQLSTPAAAEPQLEHEAEREPEREPEPQRETKREADHKVEPEPEPEREHRPETWHGPDTAYTPEPGVRTLAQFESEHASESATVAPMRKPPSHSATLPPIALAFAAILAAEQHEPMPAGWPQWTMPTGPTGPTPSTPPPASNGGGAPSEHVIEEITQRVLDRLSDRVVRETVENVISSTAERLVREEIDRIKSSIK